MLEPVTPHIFGDSSQKLAQQRFQVHQAMHIVSTLEPIMVWVTLNAGYKDRNPNTKGDIYLVPILADGGNIPVEPFVVEQNARPLRQMNSLPILSVSTVSFERPPNRIASRSSCSVRWWGAPLDTSLYHPPVRVATYASSQFPS
jgi:hypothetical protein